MKTNWTRATTNINEAVAALISCLSYGYDAWIEVQQNGEQDLPIQMINPLLDNPFNWEYAFGTIHNKKELENAKFLNETEKDLTYNWINAFGTPEAIALYQSTGKITKDLIRTSGCAHPIRREDAVKHREMYIKDDYRFESWVYYWKPKERIPYYVTNTDIKDVFVICYENRPVDKKYAVQKVGKFLLEYASQL